MRAKARNDRVCISLYDHKMSYLCISVHPGCPANVGDTLGLSHLLDVLDEQNRWRQPVSQAEFVCKRSKVVSPAEGGGEGEGGGGGGGRGGVEQQIETQ